MRLWKGVPNSRVWETVVDVQHCKEMSHVVVEQVAQPC